MDDYENQDAAFEKLRELAEKVISFRGFSTISEISPELSKSLDLLLHQLAESQTEILKQNQRLKDARDRYSDLYENSPAGYITLDPSGIITETNATIAGMLDFSKNDLLQNPFSRYIIHEDRTIFYAKLAKLQVYPQPADCKLRLFARDARQIPVELFCRPVISGLYKVDEIKMTVMMRHCSELREEYHNGELELYKSMFWKNNSPGLLIDADDGSIVSANPAACRFYGYKPEVLEELNIRDIVPSMQESEFREYIHRTFAMKKEVFNVFHRIVNGEDKYVEMHSTPLLMENKKIIFSLIHDVSEQKDLEKQLYDYVARLLKLNDELSRYALSLARNAQAPLFAVHRYTGALIRKVRSTVINGIPDADSRKHLRL